MDILAHAQALTVRQTKEWAEILTGLETRNRYVVLDNSGQELLRVAEAHRGAIVRFILGPWRPLTMSVFTPGGQPILQFRKPFRFFFARMDVLRADGSALGTVQRLLRPPSSVYSVQDVSDHEVTRIVGPFFRPWTFRIEREGQIIGHIQKRWSGLLTEPFTKADNFSVKFSADLDVREKALLLGAVFLIEFVRFESGGSVWEHRSNEGTLGATSGEANAENAQNDPQAVVVSQRHGDGDGWSGGDPDFDD